MKTKSLLKFITTQVRSINPQGRRRVRLSLIQQF